MNEHRGDNSLSCVVRLEKIEPAVIFPWDYVQKSMMKGLCELLIKPGIRKESYVAQPLSIIYYKAGNGQRSLAIEVGFASTRILKNKKGPVNNKIHSRTDGNKRKSTF